MADDHHTNSRRQLYKSALRIAGLKELDGIVWETSAKKQQTSDVVLGTPGTIMEDVLRSV